MRLDSPNTKQSAYDRERTVTEQHQRATTVGDLVVSPPSPPRCLFGYSHICPPAHPTGEAPARRPSLTPVKPWGRIRHPNRMRQG